MENQVRVLLVEDNPGDVRLILEMLKEAKTVEFEITNANKAHCNYFEKTSEELVGHTFLSLIPEAHQETVMANPPIPKISPLQSRFVFA